jgi:hypothetical protein
VPNGWVAMSMSAMPEATRTPMRDRVVVGAPRRAAELRLSLTNDGVATGGV